MKILFLTQWFDPEPGAIRGLPLAKSLQAAGEEVEVLTGFPNYPGGKIYPGYQLRPWTRQIMSGVPVLRVALYPSHDRSAAGRVLNYLSFAASASTIGLALSGKADVGYVYHPPPTVGLPGVAHKVFRGLPFVYHIADMWPESVLESGMIPPGWTKNAAERALNAYCNFVYRQADQITVLSPGFKRLLTERGVSADKVHVIYNWTDEDTFRPVEPDRELARRYGIEGTFNVIYAGNIGAFQGIDTLVRAAALVTDLKDVRIVIAGTGQREAEVKALATELGLRNVVFMGRREYWEMPVVNSLANALVVHLNDLPFFAATIPSKTQVSLASGKPVLMAVRGDSADIVRRAGCGLTCDPQNPEAMAAAIRELRAMSPERRQELGDRGRDYYLREMSLSHGSRLMQELFAETAGRSARRRRAYA